MRTRNIKINVFLNEDENQILNRKSKQAKLSKSTFIRNLIECYSSNQLSNEEITNILNSLSTICDGLSRLKNQLEFLHYSDYVNFLNAQIDKMNQIINQIQK